MPKYFTPVLAALATSAGPSFAQFPDYPDAHGCYWRDDSGPADITINLPDTLYIEANQPDGSLIAEYTLRGTHTARGNWRCWNRDVVTPVLYQMNAIAHLPPAHIKASVPFSGARALPPTDKILQTSVPGVGVAIGWSNGFDGSGWNAFDPGGPPMAPFTATLRLRHQYAIEYIAARFWDIAIVKTGEVLPGRYTLAPSEKHFSGYLSGPSSQVGHVWDVGMSGEVIVTGCGTAPNPITPNPVDLGRYEVSDFTQASHTPPVPFSLNLTGCNTPPAGTLPGIHVQMDPAQGSTVIDPDQGLFSLSGANSAQNVAVQLLRQDAQTPMPLARKQYMTVVPNGDVSLGFNARLAKIADPVKPGNVAAALKFTVTYE